MNLIARLFARKSNEKLISFEIQNSFSSFKGSLYSNSSFRAAIDAISRHVGKLTGYSSDLTISNLLQHAPNNYITAYDLLYKTATAYFTQNNAFILLQRNGGGIEALYPLMPSSVEFVGGTDGALYIKMLFPDGKQVTLPYADVVHLRRHFSNN